MTNSHRLCCLRVIQVLLLLLWRQIYEHGALIPGNYCFWAFGQLVVSVPPLYLYLVETVPLSPSSSLFLTNLGWNTFKQFQMEIKRVELDEFQVFCTHRFDLWSHRTAQACQVSGVQA